MIITKTPHPLSPYLHHLIGCNVYIFSPDDTLDNGWLKHILANQSGLNYSFILTLDNVNKVLKDGYIPILHTFNSFDYDKFEEFLRSRPVDEDAIINNLTKQDFEKYFERLVNPVTSVSSLISNLVYTGHSMPVVIEFMLNNHFDVFDLIQKGLAIDSAKIIASLL